MKRKKKKQNTRTKQLKLFYAYKKRNTIMKTTTKRKLEGKLAKRCNTRL